MDRFISVRDSELTIPGVRGNHVFLHISDLHLRKADEDSSPEEIEAIRKGDWLEGREYFAKLFGEPFTEDQRLPTVECLDRIIAYVRSERPEALLLSGDNLDQMHTAGAKYLADSLANCGVPFLCVPGNHDADTCEGVWEPGVRVLESDGFRIVGVDDRLCTVTDSDLERIEALAAEGIPMIMMFHIPAAASCNREFARRGGEYFCIDGERGDGNARRFVDFLEKCPLVKMTLCGHIHGFTVSELVPGKRQITASQAMIGSIHRLTVKGE